MDTKSETYFQLLAYSYRLLVGRPLVPDGVGADWLYRKAPFAVVAHNTASDPVFVYANRTAQRCFEYEWEEFVCLPSRLSAGPENRPERDQLLMRVSRDGYASSYRGERAAKSGRRFFIEDGVIWQLMGPDGQVYGQAATFRDPGDDRHREVALL